MVVRYRVALVLTAAAVAFWATQDVRSFLLAFLVTLFLCVFAVGLGLAIHGVSREAPATEAELERIEWQEFIDALDRMTEEP